MCGIVACHHVVFLHQIVGIMSGFVKTFMKSSWILKWFFCTNPMPSQFRVWACCYPEPDLFQGERYPSHQGWVPTIAPASPPRVHRTCSDATPTPAWPHPTARPPSRRSREQQPSIRWSGVTLQRNFCDNPSPDSWNAKCACWWYL